MIWTATWIQVFVFLLFFPFSWTDVLDDNMATFNGLSALDLQASFDLLNSPDLEFADFSPACASTQEGKEATSTVSTVKTRASARVACGSAAPEGEDAFSSDTWEGRFAKPLSDSSFTKVLNDRIPKNTTGNTRWAYTLYKEWRMWRNFRPETKDDDMWPIPTLLDGSVEALDYWLARFITEINRQDQKPYNAGNMSCYIF